MNKDSEISAGTVDVPSFSSTFPNTHNNLAENKYSHALIGEAMALGFLALCFSKVESAIQMLPARADDTTGRELRGREERMWINASSHICLECFKLEDAF